MRYEYRYKPKKCPACKSIRVATIYYGMMPMTDELQGKIEAGKVVLGGCCITMNEPTWKCSDCDVDIYRKEKPVQDFPDL